MSNIKGPLTGRVIMGLGTPGPAEMTIQELEGKKTPIFDDEAGRELLERVREKARDMAKDVLSQAMAEAEALKASAREEGYKEGLKRAEAECGEHVRGLSEHVAAILGEVQSQGRTVWRAQKADLVALVRLAVEKTLAVELAERRSEVLGSLLEEALELIESSRELTVRVHPDDAGLMDELLAEARERHPGLVGWKIRPEPRLTEGGVVVESASGMVDNALKGRRAALEPIFEQLAAEPSEPADSASSADPAQGQPQAGEAK